MTKPAQGDIAHITAIVEMVSGANVQLIVKGDREYRPVVPIASVLKFEKGPIKAGDTVKVTRGKTTVTAKVLHRIGDAVWVERKVGETVEHTIENIADVRHPA